MRLVPSRHKVFDLQNAMASFPPAKFEEGTLVEPGTIELKVVHHFSKAVYARELHIPAGVTLIGEIHKFENLNILSAGTMLVTTEEGMREVSAPFTVVSPPGTKRAAHTLTDCVWTTIHGTEEKDIELIKNHFIAASEQEWLEFCGLNQLEFKL